MSAKELLKQKLITQFVSGRLVAYLAGLVVVALLGKNLTADVAKVLLVLFGGYFTAKTAEQIGNAIAAKKKLSVDETIPEDRGGQG